jgi:hypothetical protein
MDANLCKNFEKCPIYTGILEGKSMTTQAYQNQYCRNGKQGWQDCRRYQVKEKTGKCPADLLPNSFKSVDQIISELSS